MPATRKTNAPTNWHAPGWRRSRRGGRGPHPVRGARATAGLASEGWSAARKYPRPGRLEAEAVRPIARPRDGDPTAGQQRFMPAISEADPSDAPSLTKPPARAGGLAMGRAPAVLVLPRAKGHL